MNARAHDRPAYGPHMTSGDTLTGVVPVTTDGDHDRFAHVVNRTELAALAPGQPITALCGKRWVPDANPERYPLCKTCAAIRGDQLARRDAAGSN